MAGLKRVKLTLQDHEGGSVEFADHADPGGDGKPYLKQSWGAFGAAYESQLREAGVLGDAEAHSLSVPTKVIGDDFSRVFARAAGDLGPKFLRVVRAGKASLAMLEELAPLLPSRIHRKARSVTPTSACSLRNTPTRPRRTVLGARFTLGRLSARQSDWDE